MGGMLNRIRPLVARVFLVGAKGFWRLGFSPNMVTLLGFAVTALGALLVVVGWVPFAILLVALGGFLDGVDGALARMINRVTRFGGALDSVLDRYGDALLIGAVWFSLHVEFLLGLFALMGSLITSYSRARLEVTGLSLSSVGLLERPERIILLLLTLLFGGYANYFFVALAALSNFTVVQRVLYGRRMLGES